MTGTSALASSPGVPRAALNTGAGLWPSSIAVAGRTVRKFARTPQLIAFTTIQSALFLLMFRFAFGGAIGTGDSLSYVSFLVPGFIATTVLWSGMGAATGVAEDVEHHVVRGGEWQMVISSPAYVKRHRMGKDARARQT